MKRSLYLKFLAVQIPVVILVAALALHFLGEVRVTEARAAFSARIGAQAARIAALVNELSLPQDNATANRRLALLLADPGVLCVEMKMDGLAPGDVAAPRRIGCRGQTPDEMLTIGLPDPGGSVVLGLSLAEIRETQRQSRDFGIALATGCVLLAALAASLAFRRTVGRPLAKLLAGIRDAERHGRPVTIANVLTDEIGEVIDAFNMMQERLEAERRTVCAVRDKINALYNATPALLFTLSMDGRILSASDFWLESAGYEREKIVGSAFADILDTGSGDRLRGDLLKALVEGRRVREAPVKVLRGDGSSMDALFSAVRRGTDSAAVCAMTDVSLLRAAENRLRDLALTDHLTGLPNRAGFSEAVQRLAALPVAERASSAAMLIDLDNFKKINDTMGHEAGDVVLVEVARRIRGALRDGDVIARLGGDEFVILCRRMNRKSADMVASRLVEAITPPVDLGAGIFGSVGASIGVAFAEGDVLDGADLLRRADEAMYHAKRSGKGRFAVAPPRRRVA